jgi:hypothetical protein
MADHPERLEVRISLPDDTRFIHLPGMKSENLILPHDPDAELSLKTPPAAGHIHRFGGCRLVGLPFGFQTEY